MSAREAFYSIIQFCADFDRAETINIGVAIFVVPDGAAALAGSGRGGTPKRAGKSNERAGSRSPHQPVQAHLCARFAREIEVVVVHRYQCPQRREQVVTQQGDSSARRAD